MGDVTTHLRVAALLVALVLAVAGCTTPLTQPGPSSDPGQAPAQGGAPLGTTLRIVAGSEHRSVLDQVVIPWCQQHRYDCQYTLKGSVDQARILAGGGGDYEAYWFASSVFAQLGNTSGQLTDVQPMFLTPIVYAGWKSEMERLGFGPGADVTVQQVLDAVEGGQTKVWATNPTQSNSGATMYFAFLNHFAGNGPGQALTAEQLASAPVKDGISRFVQAMDRTPPSTGTMMRECLEAAPGQCQTLFTYEDLVIESNHELEAAGREPLTVAYPRGALAISDAPLGFFPRSDADNEHRRKVFTELQAFLLTDPGAREALTKLGRRPADSVGLTLTDPDLGVFNPAWGIRTDVREQAIVFPAAPVIQQALDDYHSTFRQAASVYYCLDGSGSMSGAGWDGVKAAAAEIFDPERAKVNLLQTAPDDATTVAIFNSGITRGPETIEGNADADLLKLKALVDGYRPGGGTNMYTCLSEAVRAQASDGRKKIATPVALLSAVVVFVAFFLLLPGAGPLLQVGVPAALAAVAATGVAVMLGRTPAEITDDAYASDADGVARKAQATMDAVTRAARDIGSAAVRDDVAQIAKQVPELLRRTRAEAPNSLYSSASALDGHLTSLLGVVTQYADLERNPEFYANAPQLTHEGREAVRRFRDFTLESIRLINAGGIAEYRANLDTVAPPAIPDFGGDPS